MYYSSHRIFQFAQITGMCLGEAMERVSVASEAANVGESNYLSENLRLMAATTESNNVTNL